MKNWFLCRLHISWFIGWASLGIVIGTGLCLVVNNRLFSDQFWLVIASSLAIISLVSRRAWMVLLIFCAGSLVGLFKGSIVQVQLEAYQPYYGRIVTLSGRVSQDASYGERGDQRLNLADILIDNNHLQGEVWASVVKTNIKRGDRVTLKGQLREGFGNMSATMSRAEVESVIRPNPGDVARRVRDWFGEGVRKAIPEPQVSLGLGYLVGQKTVLPKDLEEQIKIVGLTHVVVASGYNLTILVMFSRQLFLKISKYFATLSSSLMIVSFMLVTGLSPSMSRAGLVAGLGLVVWYYGRKMHPFVLLSFAAAITVLVDPSYVWGDLGWYLSFGAFIGVIVLAPLLHNYFWEPNKKLHMIRQLMVETMSAQIVTQPLILLAFGLYSTYALPANILILPLVPLAMLCTFLAGIAGLIAPALAPLVGLPATWILSYSTGVIEKVANLPNSQKEFEFNPILMIASYIAIAITIIYIKRRTKYDFRNSDQADRY